MAGLCNQVGVGPLPQETARGPGGLLVVRRVGAGQFVKTTFSNLFLVLPTGEVKA